MQKRLGSLSTLESTFISVEAAAGDVEVGRFRAYFFAFADILATDNEEL